MFICSFTYIFVCLFVYSFTHLFIQACIHVNIDLFINVLFHSPTNLCILCLYVLVNGFGFRLFVLYLFI